MNERIKELYKEATGKSFANDFDARVLEAEKFAELLVKECSKVNNQYVGWRIGDIDLDMVYKEHFGVE